MLHMQHYIRVPLTMLPDQIAAVDEWRRVQIDLPPRAEAIRRLVESGLTAYALRSQAAQNGPQLLRKKSNITINELD